MVPSSETKASPLDPFAGPPFAATLTSTVVPATRLRR